VNVSRERTFDLEHEHQAVKLPPISSVPGRVLISRVFYEAGPR
jgi:hypothetical protein